MGKIGELVPFHVKIDPSKEYGINCGLCFPDGTRLLIRSITKVHKDTIVGKGRITALKGGRLTNGPKA